jgi:hypothetical protein
VGEDKRAAVAAILERYGGPEAAVLPTAWDTDDSSGGFSFDSSRQLSASQPIRGGGGGGGGRIPPAATLVVERRLMYIDDERPSPSAESIAASAGPPHPPLPPRRMRSVCRVNDAAMP